MSNLRQFPGACAGMARINGGRDAEFRLIRAGDGLTETGFGIRSEQRDRASAETAAGHARAVDSIDGEGGVHQEIELRATHFVIVLQAAVGFHHQLAHGIDVACGTGFDEAIDASIFGDDVARAARDQLRKARGDARELFGRDIAQTLDLGADRYDAFHGGGTFAHGATGLRLPLSLRPGAQG